LRGKDGKTKQAVLNQKTDNYTKNDMSLTGFNATIEAGVSFQAQKTIGAAQLQMLIQSDPQLMPLLADKLAENLQVENMTEIVERIQEFQLGMPISQIISKETGKPVVPPPPNPAAQQAAADLQLRQGELQNDQMETALKAQDQMTKALDSHAKYLNESKKIASEAATQALKSRAELGKAAMDNHVKLTTAQKNIQKSYLLLPAKRASNFKISR